MDIIDARKLPTSALEENRCEALEEVRLYKQKLRELWTFPAEQYKTGSILIK
ncbi:hypothetical protein [Microbulbifer variabilis]|uniref:hypothetical protein n=1 Tax=Microbulbifer variabilis TaxID=266805 RepID=UPI001CFEBB5F|nr:hypothetical protein [Microbulbifer variabilis]